jgi:tetraacyldisaccharide 4'-kinase
VVEWDCRAREGQVVTCVIEPTYLTLINARRRVPLDTISGRSVLAVAALALPGSFVANLQAAGATVELVAYPDHHEFTANEAGQLVDRAAGRPIVITLKDAVKLRRFWQSGGNVFVLHQAVRIGTGEALLEAALRRIASMIPG